MAQVNTDTIHLTTPLEVYYAFKETPTTYWAAKIIANQYLGDNDKDPQTLQPNVCGPIVDPENVTFVERFEPEEDPPLPEGEEPPPPILNQETIDFLRSFDLIMIVDSYFQVPAFHKGSFVFNQRTRLCEILKEKWDKNQAIKNFFPIRKAPTLFIKDTDTPLVFARYRRDITFPVIYELLREKVAQRSGNVFTSTDYEYPEKNRYKTCGGTVLEGKVVQARKYEFDFGLKDFKPVPMNVQEFEGTDGISKILVGKKILPAEFTSLFNNKNLKPPYRLKVFFKSVDKSFVTNTIQGIMGPHLYVEINGAEEMSYRINKLPGESDEDFLPFMINLLTQLQEPEKYSFIERKQRDIERKFNKSLPRLPKYKTEPSELIQKIEQWGLGAPDTILKFQVNTNFVIISERPILNELEGEDVLEKIMDSVKLTNEEIDAVRLKYDEFLEQESNALVQDTPELFNKWLDDAETRKRQKLYFQRNAPREVDPTDQFAEDAAPIPNSTSTGETAELERYVATGDVPVEIYGSYERALDEAKRIILKEFETVVLPNGDTSVEYKDYYIGTYRKYHSNGFLQRIENYKNENKASKSLLDGPYLEFFDDGRRQIIGGFQDDLLHGPYKEFYQNTLPKCQGTLRRGKLNGVYVQWDDEGNRLLKSYFIGGTLNNSYVLDYQVFASTPCLSRNDIFIALSIAFEKTELDDNIPPNEVPRAYTFTELFNLLTFPDPSKGEVIEGLKYPLLDIDNQPERQLLAILDQIANRISGGVRHGRYILKENISLV
jgi:predicted DNA-binding protein (UPF0251 family)